MGKDLLLGDEYTTLQKRLRKFKVRQLLRQRAKYLEQKINPTCRIIDQIMVSLESGSWQTSSFENIPLITTYALIQWVFEYPRQSNGHGFPFDRPHLDFYPPDHENIIAVSLEQQNKCQLSFAVIEILPRARSVIMIEAKSNPRALFWDLEAKFVQSPMFIAKKVFRFFH